MTKLLALAVIAMSATACGSGPSRLPLYNYPDAIKAGFMDACVSAASRDRPVEQAQSLCRCALLKIEDRIPASDVRKIPRPDAPASVTAAASDAITSCAK